MSRDGRLLTWPVVAWALYDWGGAAFNAVITTFVFTVYLTSSSFGAADVTSSALGTGLGIAGLVIALLAPITGQRADRANRRTFWLGANSSVVFAISAALFFIRPEPSYLWIGVALIGAGNIFQEFAGVNYNALLPRVSTPATIGRVSALGWGAGYIGGIVLLLFLFLAFIQPDPGLFGVTHADGMNVRVAMLFAAAWFGISMIPVLVTVRDVPRVATGVAGDLTGVAGGADVVTGVTGERDVRDVVRRPRTPAAAFRSLVDSYVALWRTVRGLARTNPHTLYFLVASAIFRDGLAGVFTFGGIIAAGTFGFSPGQVIVFGIVANVVAGIATIGMGVLDDRLGPKRLIEISLVAMILAGLGVFFLHDRGPSAFWVTGLLLAIWVGPAQSASRTFLARLIPPGREGEIFGLYATTGRAVSPLAPFFFSVAIGVGHAVLPDGANAQHWGILGILLVLLAGLLLLIPVHPRPQEMYAVDQA